MAKLKTNSATVPSLTETAFCAWLGQAHPNEVLAYHRGLLALDTSPHSQTIHGQGRKELSRIARRAWWAAEHGLVNLLQRRNGPDDFSYLAIVRHRTPEAAVSLSTLLLKEIA